MRLGGVRMILFGGDFYGIVYFPDFKMERDAILRLRSNVLEIDVLNKADMQLIKNKNRNGEFTDIWYTQYKI